MLPLACGMSLLVPELEAFARLPRTAIVNYSGQASALAHTALVSGTALAAARLSWPEIPTQTQSEIESVLGRANETAVPGRPIATPEAIWVTRQRQASCDR